MLAEPPVIEGVESNQTGTDMFLRADDLHRNVFSGPTITREHVSSENVKVHGVGDLRKFPENLKQFILSRRPLTPAKELKLRIGLRSLRGTKSVLAMTLFKWLTRGRIAHPSWRHKRKQKIYIYFKLKMQITRHEGETQRYLI